jgi:starvation-inducible DNA-binding protein
MEKSRSEKNNKKNTAAALTAKAQPAKNGKSNVLAKAPVTAQRSRSMPLLNQRAPEIQKFGERFPVPVGLPDEVIETSIATLNQTLADTMVLRDMYKKHHWQVSGPTFYQLHLLLDAHYEAQAALMDMLAERIQAFGGISIAMPHDVAEMSKIERPPRGREEVPVQLSRLLEAHELILTEARKGAKEAADSGDDGTNDILVSNVIRTNEAQAWFISEHLVALPVVSADGGGVDKNSLNA